MAPEELGSCSSISSETFGDTRVTVFRQDGEESRISTLLLRACPGVLPVGAIAGWAGRRAPSR